MHALLPSKNSGYYLYVTDDFDVIDCTNGCIVVVSGTIIHCACRNYFKDYSKIVAIEVISIYIYMLERWKQVEHTCSTYTIKLTPISLY